MSDPRFAADDLVAFATAVGRPDEALHVPTAPDEEPVEVGGPAGGHK